MGTQQTIVESLLIFEHPLMSLNPISQLFLQADVGLTL
jgi:hypothetical protein